MHSIQDWIDVKLKEIADVLPELVKESPSSFGCRLKMGYKNALLDLCEYLELSVAE